MVVAVNRIDTEAVGVRRETLFHSHPFSFATPCTVKIMLESLLKRTYFANVAGGDQWNGEKHAS